MMTIQYYWERCKVGVLVLLLIAFAFLISGVIRYRRGRERAIRRAAEQLQSSGRTFDEIRSIEKQRTEHLSTAQQHADAARDLRKNIQEIATLLRDEGHPKMADLVRRWNRE